MVCFVFFCGGVCCLTLSLNLFLKKFLLAAAGWWISCILCPYTRNYRKPASPFISCLLLILSQIMLTFGGLGWRRGFPRNKLNKASCSAKAGNVLQYWLAHKEWKILTKQNSRRWSVNWIVLPSCRQIESHTPHAPSSPALMCLNLEGEKKLKKIHMYRYCASKSNYYAVPLKSNTEGL